jgi:molybdopterin-guanine dinucleotide biosynthesis protein A
VTTKLDGCAALLLAGGSSRRMGRDKASLEWHGSTLAFRLAGLLARVCAPVVVVVAPRQRLPRLPSGIELVEDEHVGEGPLEGLATGLGVLVERVDRAFAAAVDLPFLQPALVRAVCEAIGDAEAAVPQHDGHPQPLCACYRVHLAARARALLAAGERRASLLAPPEATVTVDAENLREHDPELRSFRTIHDPAGYDAALAVPQPRVQVQTRWGLEERRAATLELALTAPRPETIVLNGNLLTVDGALPLVEGDMLSPP